MFKPTELTNDVMIKIIGVGGDGGNTAEHMVRKHIEDVGFFAVNTDAQALRKMTVGQTVQIGSGITRGLGAGANPEVGRSATDGDREALRATLDSADTVLIIADMDDGTGAGVAPVITEIAENLGILTVAVVTKPFNFKGKERMAFTEQGIAELSRHVDSPIAIPSDKLLKVLGRDISPLDAFGAVDDVLKGAVQGTAELITRPGPMNVDFADIHTVMSEMDYTMMGSGVTSGEDRVGEATGMAISSPLLEDIDLSGAHDVLVNIAAGFDLRLDEFETVGNTIRAFASDNTTMVISTSLDPDMNDELRITVVATGIGMDKHLEIILVINKQIQQPVTDRYQQHGIAPLTQERKPVVKAVNNNMPQTTRELDYLDIPTFLRKQAD